MLHGDDEGECVVPWRRVREKPAPPRRESSEEIIRQTGSGGAVDDTTATSPACGTASRAAGTATSCGRAGSDGRGRRGGKHASPSADQYALVPTAQGHLEREGISITSSTATTAHGRPSAISWNGTRTSA